MKLLDILKGLNYPALQSRPGTASTYLPQCNCHVERLTEVLIVPDYCIVIIVVVLLLLLFPASTPCNELKSINVEEKPSHCMHDPQYNPKTVGFDVVCVYAKNFVCVYAKN